VRLGGYDAIDYNYGIYLLLLLVSHGVLAVLLWLVGLRCHAYLWWSFGMVDYYYVFCVG